MASKPAFYSNRKESVSTAGVIIALLLFGLVSLALVMFAIKNKPGSAAPANNVLAEQTPTAPAPPAIAKLEVLKNQTAPKPAIKSAQEKKREKSATVIVLPMPIVTQAPPPKQQPQQPAQRIERPRQAAINPAPRVSAVPQQTTVDVVKTESDIQPSARLITPADMNNAENAKPAQSVEKVDQKSLGGKAIPWYSVRVGYTDSKTRADILRDVLSQQGFIKAQTLAAGDGNFYVSLGDYMFRYQAEDVAENIRKKTSMEPQIYEKTVAK